MRFFPRTAAAACFAVLAAVFSGCSSAMIESVSRGERASYGLQSGGDDLRRETVNILENLMLYEKFDDDPAALLTELKAKVLREKDPDLILAMADIAYRAGLRTRDEDMAARFHLTSVMYAYTYISIDPSPEFAAYSPERITAVQLYNRALTEFFDHMHRRKLWRHDAFQFLTVCGARISFLKPEVSLPFPVRHYSDCLLCADYRTRGLTHDSYRFGLGVPLIGLPVEGMEEPDIEDFDTEIPEPITAVLRFYVTGEVGSREIGARICLYSTRKTESISVNGQKIPLSLDFSTPTVYRTKVKSIFELVGYMLDPGADARKSGLAFLEPVDSDKIPVVFVHGLMSSPQTWLQMINTLQSDPEIRRNYQFWSFSYSTGSPVLYSARKLRQSLCGVRKRMLDRKMDVSKFDRMILVGHSMGGLLSKAMVIDSGSTMIESIFGVSVEDFEKPLTPEHRKTMREIMIFQRLPFVKRVVFIAVPHRGSDIAFSWIGRLGAALIKPPHELVGDTHFLLRELAELGEIKRVTGISNLDPGDAMLSTLARIPLPGDLPYHSIIGNRRRGGVPGGSDGVVPYSSSHLDGAASELIVKSNHSAQQNPIAIQEVRRILLSHLRKIERDEKKMRAPEKLNAKSASDAAAAK